MAKIVLQSNSYAFVLVKNARVLTTGTQDGIGELLAAVDRFGSALQGAVLADKIAGKAVAMVAAYAGIRSLYTPLGSEAAEAVCSEHHIAFEADQLVPLIRNKRQDGPCPMERLTMEISDPATAVSALREFVAARRNTPPTL